MSGIAEILDRLEAVKPTRDGWMARCPAHDDKTPSLSIAERDGRILLKDFAGCSADSIVTALGLTMADLMPPKAISTKRRTTTTQNEIRGVDGTLEAIHERIDGPDGKKFSWRRPDGSTGLGGRRVVDLPLFGSHRIAKFPDQTPIVLAEGERATDALLRAGLSAVGTVTGATATPSDDVLQTIAAHPVTLWPDHDAPGRDHMARIGARLVALGCPDVRVVNWPDSPEKGDAADYPRRPGVDCRGGGTVRHRLC